jgi:hypothetical protein
LNFVQSFVECKVSLADGTWKLRGSNVFRCDPTSVFVRGDDGRGLSPSTEPPLPLAGDFSSARPLICSVSAVRRKLFRSSSDTSTSPWYMK